MTKQSYIDCAHRLGWTKKDADRAYSAAREEDRAVEPEIEMLRTLAQFAGPELSERQRLQAAQKSQVTKKNKLLSHLEQEHSQRLQALEAEADRERSQLVPIIDAIYGFAQKFGLKDPWIEALLATYDEYRAS